MGKKYDDYIKGQLAEEAAKRDLAVAAGGSTQQRMQEAQTNAEQAERNSNYLFQEMLKDPEG